MKTQFRLLALVVILALAIPAVHAATDEPGAPYDPETVPAHPTLLETYEDFFPPEVIPVTDDVWVARGYNRDNPALIEGLNGLIVVDPGESIPAAQVVKDAFNAHLDYTLNVRKGILEANPPSSGSGQFVIITDSLTWKELVMGKLDTEDAVANGKVVISGGAPESFYSFMDLFE